MVALTVGVLAAGCGTAQSALPSVAAGAPLRYSAYCDTQGQVRNEEWALALMRHSSHREQVYLQASQGLYPASEVWLQLEAVCRAAGGWTAQEHAGPKCAVLPAELGCEFNWNPVRELVPGEGPGQQRLLDAFKQGYDARWEQLKRGAHARAETVRAGMLVAAVVLGRAPATAEAAEGGAAESRALGAEARAAAAEGTAGAGAARLVSAETLGLSRALGAEEASALEARLLEWEAEAPGTRESFSQAEVREGRLRPKVRPDEVAENSALWSEFEAYRQRRLLQVRAQWQANKGPLTVKPPLRWDGYQQLREHFWRCAEFESKVGGILARDLELPASSRRVLKESSQPLLARHVGTTKSGQVGVRYPDFLAVDEATLEEGGVPRVESVSVKKRNFSGKSKREVELQVDADLKEALGQYGGRLEVRRPGHPLYGRTVQVSKVHLVYERTSLGKWQELIQQLCKKDQVEVHFE
jgi:hypothetical protein